MLPFIILGVLLLGAGILLFSGGRRPSRGGSRGRSRRGSGVKRRYPAWRTSDTYINLEAAIHGIGAVVLMCFFVWVCVLGLFPLVAYGLWIWQPVLWLGLASMLVAYLMPNEKVGAFFFKLTFVLCFSWGAVALLGTWRLDERANIPWLGIFRYPPWLPLAEASWAGMDSAIASLIKWAGGG